MPEQDMANEREQSHDGHRSLVVQEDVPESVIGSLFYEQGRLRADLDRLMNAPAPKPDEKPKDDPPAKEKEAGKDDAKDAGDTEAKGKEEKKEPFLKRSAIWVKTHAIATVAILILLVALLVGGWFLWNYLQSYE